MNKKTIVTTGAEIRNLAKTKQGLFSHFRCLDTNSVIEFLIRFATKPFTVVKHVSKFGHIVIEFIDKRVSKAIRDFGRKNGISPISSMILA